MESEAQWFRTARFLKWHHREDEERRWRRSMCHLAWYDAPNGQDGHLYSVEMPIQEECCEFCLRLLGWRWIKPRPSWWDEECETG